MPAQCYDTYIKAKIRVKIYNTIRPQHQPQRQPQVYSAKLHMISDNYTRKDTTKTKYISKT